MNQGNDVKQLSIERRWEIFLRWEVLNGVENKLLMGLDFGKNQLITLLQWWWGRYKGGKEWFGGVGLHAWEYKGLY